MNGRHGQHCLDRTGRVRGIRVADKDDLALPRGHFLHVGDGLVEELVSRGDHDDRHALVDQRDRAMLQLAGGIAFGMDVGDLLELERTFERDRITRAAAEIENIPCLGQAMGQLFVRRFVPENLGHVTGYFHQRLDEFGLELRTDRAPRLARRDCETRQHGELTGEGLGRGHADLRTAECRQNPIRFARNRRFAHIHHGQDMLALLPAIAQRGQRVGCLAGLRHEERRTAGLHRDLAVTKLRGDIHVDRQLRPALEPIFRDEAGIERRAAGRQRQTADIRKVERQIRQGHLIVRKVQVMRERMAHHFRLFVNLLGHEVAEIALVHHQSRGAGLDDGAVDNGPVAPVNSHVFARDDGPIAVFQISDIVRERCKCDGIGADEHLAVAIADGKRASLARRDHEVVIALEDHREREGPLQMRKNLVHGGHGVLSIAQLARDEVGDHFGVRVGREGSAFGLKLGLQLAKILDDAVMHDCHVVGHMRVGVCFAWLAMGGPARMADAGIACQRLGRQQGFQVAQLALGTAPLDAMAIHSGDARGIVAAIFEALERIDQHFRDRPFPEDANNSAHRPLPPYRHQSCGHGFCFLSLAS